MTSKEQQKYYPLNILDWIKYLMVAVIKLVLFIFINILFAVQKGFT